MRLTPETYQCIKTYWQEHLPAAKVYLFGSRVDDAQRGGDIDLLVLNEKKLTLNEKIKFLDHFMARCGEQKLDIVSYGFDEKQPFKEIALANAIEL